MGSSGPCGPCTEIHFDHYGSGPKFVNAGRDDLVSDLYNFFFFVTDAQADKPKCFKVGSLVVIKEVRGTKANFHG